MKTVKRIVFWLLLVEFAAACVWWIFTFPYDPARLYSVIPEEATLVTDHVALAERWPRVAGCPALAAALRGGGVHPRAAAGIDSPAVRRLVARFCPTRTLVAVLPPGPSGATGWMLATWAGRQAQYLRLGLMDRHLGGVKRLRAGTETVWQWQGRDLPAGHTVSMAVHEGILIVCLSRDPMAAARLRLRAMRVPPPPAWMAESPEGWGDGFAGALDRAWVRVPGSARAWRIRLNGMNAEGCLGAAAIAHPLPLARRLPPDADAAMADLPIPPGTVAVGTLTAGDAAAWIERSSSPQPVKDTVRWVCERHLRADAPLVAWVASGEWSARTMSLRVPSVFLAVPVTNADAAVADAAGALDLLNAGWRTSYLPRGVTVEGYALTAFSSAQQTGDDVVPPDEKPAIAPLGRWVVFCGNAQVLGRALAAAAAGGGGRQPGIGSMPPALAADASATLWVDTAPAADAARNLKAVYELWLLLKEPARPPVSRRELMRVDPWLDRLAPLGEVGLAVSGGADRTVVAFGIRSSGGGRSAAEGRTETDREP